MSNWNISVGSTDSLVDGLPSGVNNNVGTLRAAGTVESSLFVSDAVNLGQSLYITVVSGLADVDSPLSNGVFNGGDQVIVKVTDDFAGVPNNTLVAGASNSANEGQSINQLAAISTFYYKTAVRTGGWNEYSGVFDPAVSVAYAGGWDNTTDSDQAADLKANDTDNAANPTAAVPGELVYRNGSPNPIQDQYKAKTSW
jgi:hypothetical protein